MAISTDDRKDGALMTAADAMLGEVEVFNRQILGVAIPQHVQAIGQERGLFRLKHLREELQEFEETLALETTGPNSAAEKVGDLADAMVDLIYVAMGTLLEMGVTPGAAFRAVHDANMKKRRGEVSKRPGSMGHDAIKPEGWTPPDMVEATLSITPEIVRNLSPMFIEAAKIRAERGRTYNQGSVGIEDYFPLGHPSYYQMVYLKLLRARSIMEGAEGSLSDSLIDGANYAAFWYEFDNAEKP